MYNLASRSWQSHSVHILNFQTEKYIDVDLSCFVNKGKGTCAIDDLIINGGDDCMRICKFFRLNNMHAMILNIQYC